MKIKSMELVPGPSIGPSLTWDELVATKSDGMYVTVYAQQALVLLVRKCASILLSAVEEIRGTPKQDICHDTSVWTPVSEYTIRVKDADVYTWDEMRSECGIYCVEGVDKSADPSSDYRARMVVDCFGDVLLVRPTNPVTVFSGPDGGWKKMNFRKMCGTFGRVADYTNAMKHLYTR